MKAGKLIVTMRTGTKTQDGRTLLDYQYVVKKTVNRLEPVIGQTLSKKRLSEIMAADRNLTVEVIGVN